MSLYSEAIFGTTLLGKHDLQECQTLQKQYAIWIGQLGNQFLNIRGVWEKKDPSGAASFANDLKALISRWRTASEGVESLDKNSPTIPILGKIEPPDYFSEKVYQNLIRAVHQGGEGSPPQSGDFADLTTRLQSFIRLAGATPINYTPAVQPQSQGVADKLLRNVGPGGLGAPKAVASSPWFKGVVVIAALFGVGYVVNTAANAKRLIT